MISNIKHEFSNGNDDRFVKEPITLIAVSLLFALTLLVGFSIYWNTQNLRNEKIQLAIAEARANWNKDQAFRGWATKHGGVYVAPNERTPPSPYLAHIPNRDIVTTDGKKLTLMNPAYMMRQMTEEYEESYGIKGSITGKVLLNPVNAPDEWEKKVLDLYDSSPQEVIEETSIDGHPYIRLMKPMVMKEGCVKCHGHLGFKTGDIRGGVSVSIPLKPYFDAADISIQTINITHLVIWIVGYLGVMLFSSTARKREADRLYLKNSLERNQAYLEYRVEERTRELKIKEEELLHVHAREHHANKMASLGEMASGMAHEINTPLQSINLSAHKLKKCISRNVMDKADNEVFLIEKSVDKITNIIDSLRKISRDSSQQSFELVTVESIVEDVLSITQERYRLANIDFSINYHHQVNHTEINCQPIQISQILMNLLNNAYDEAENCDEKWMRLDIDDLGDQIEFSVTDCGKGIPEEIQNRIFEPLFTSKDIGKGTGLGLSISLEIAKRHEGELKYDAESENTRFVLVLPKNKNN